MEPAVVVPTDNLALEPYASIVCYPKPEPREVQSRIKELKMLGVEAVEFSGKPLTFNVPVLGKGYVGIVVVAHVGGKRVALKMRRVDADRQTLEQEAEMLSKANSVGVGPRFLAVGKDFLLMHLVEGYLLIDWLQTHCDRAVFIDVLVDVLEQCWRLDQVGLDHGELSKAPKHLLVDKANKPFIVDFETASVMRNASNVTSVCQFLFQGSSEAAKAIAQTLGIISKEELVRALRNYKKDRNRQNFEEVLRVALAEPI